MRALLVLFAGLGLAACDGWSSYSDDDGGAANARASREFEQDAADAYKAERDREEADEAAAGDLSAPRESAAGPAGARSCGGIGDAEAFVRCVYAGLESGTIDLTDPEHVSVVFYGGAAQAERVEAFSQTPIGLRQNMARIQRATLCACTEPGPDAFRIRSVAVGPITGDRADARVTPQSGGVVVIELARQGGAWFIDDAHR